MTSSLHLAELNVARARYPFDDPRMAGFVAAVDRVNAAADRSPGFVWRLPDDAGFMNSPGDPRVIVNLSVWESIDALREFLSRTIHREFHRRKDEWFEPLDERYLVMWDLPAGHRPSLQEGLARLERLRTDGPTEEAFGWRWAAERRRRAREAPDRSQVSGGEPAAMRVGRRP